MLLTVCRLWLRSLFQKPGQSRKRSSPRREHRAAEVEILENRSLLSATAGIAAVNTAPVMANGTMRLGTIGEDQTTNGGYLVDNIVQGRVTDSDAGALSGIAITSTTSGTGLWQFSTDGGASWESMGTVSGSNSLLLRSIDYVRLIPDTQNGTLASLTFRAWDQTSGVAGNKVDTSLTSGSTAFSGGKITANLTVQSMNDSPVLHGANNFTSITTADVNNAGQLVSTLIAGQITDVDESSLQGIAIVDFQVGSGGWQYSVDDGATWSNIDTVFRSSALLLRPIDRLRYAPYGTEPTSASLTFLAWDQTSGTAGTRFNAYIQGGFSRTYSRDQATSRLIVGPVLNHAPVLTGGTINVSPITEDQTTNGGYLVSDMLLGRLTDSDAGALSGIALTGTSSGNGTWQFSTNGGTNWSDFGTVSATSSLLLRSVDLVRFVPDAKNGATASLTFRGWDQTSGAAGTKVDTSTSGETTAFSLSQITAKLLVTSMNDAPVLSGANDFKTITEDQTTNGGNLVSSLVAGKITDVDKGSLLGIAVTGLNSGGGKWQYSIDYGSTWSEIVSVSVGSALLLRPNDRLRFIPSILNGTTASVTFRGWDQTSGTAGAFVSTSNSGGIRAFSSDQATAKLLVTSVNDAPVLAGANNFRTITEDQTSNPGDLVASLIAGKITDVDTQALTGVAVVGLSKGNGNWQYSVDGAVSWSNLDSASTHAALLLKPTDRLRFVPNGQNGTSASVFFHAWDQTEGTAGATFDISGTGGTKSFSALQTKSTITVNSVNDAPVLSGANSFPTISRTNTSNMGSSVASLIDGQVTDVDPGSSRGIAIVGLSSSNGKWQYSTNDGQFWADVGTVNSSASLLLRSSDRLRFVPNGTGPANVSISYRAWDQTTGTVGTKIPLIAAGQTTAFSSATAMSKLIVT